ncbi:hypothetical protein [Alkalibacillus aidingensis]|uniref:hypothetical protein n=1 Tax=Alkalibacillus aidingensis TaxID=2747607 RepID=UPI00166174E1|nr:hypothetical protein [Alkalibacillus aidingensis]
MNKRNLALAATGEDEGAFLAWGERAVGKENTKQWSSGKDIFKALEQATNQGKDCLEKIYIFSHAWPYSPNGNRGGVKLGGIDHAGFYSYRLPIDSDHARYIQDLNSLVQQGRIKFCHDCEIILTGCRVAASYFPQELAAISGCTVIAAMGSSYPQPGQPPGDVTGEWISGVGLWEEQVAAQDGLYVGWLRYNYNQQSQQIDVERIGEQTQHGYMIRIW